jgi:lipase chaperone LimK
MLGILGGFSADLLYSFLSRMVETCKSLFQGGAQAMVDSKTQEAKARLASQSMRDKMKLTQDLMKLQQQMGNDLSPDAQQQLNQMLQGLTGGTDIQEATKD